VKRSLVWLKTPLEQQLSDLDDRPGQAKAQRERIKHRILALDLYAKFGVEFDAVEGSRGYGDLHLNVPSDQRGRVAALIEPMNGSVIAGNDGSLRAILNDKWLVQHMSTLEVKNYVSAPKSGKGRKQQKTL